MDEDRPLVTGAGWQRLRVALGLAQMLGGLLAMLLILDRGVTRLTLGVAVVTGLATSISVVLFGSYQRK